AVCRIFVLRSPRVRQHPRSYPTRRSSDLARVQGAVRGFKRVDTRYFSDGGVEIDVEMSLEGMLPELLGHSEETPAPTLPSKGERDRKSTRLNSSHVKISYAVFCLKKKK